jgi:hypothetical protein
MLNFWNKKFYKKQIDSVVIMVNPMPIYTCWQYKKKVITKEQTEEIEVAERNISHLDNA